MISHVKFVSIPTRDQDRALKFWTERLGCRVLTDQAVQRPAALDRAADRIVRHPAGAVRTSTTRASSRA